MSEDAPAAIAAAGQALRETAKWLVGGVAATAAGVFAGSSLTSLGALDPQEDFVRLALAAGGALAGFTALGAVFLKAGQVLTYNVRTVREIIAISPSVTQELDSRYAGRLPKGASNLADYVALVKTARQADPRSSEDQALIDKAEKDFPTIGADGAFTLLKAQYTALTKTLLWATIAAVLGFGIFAWAANPPKNTPQGEEGPP